jgi:hypothetical protein
LDQVAAEEEKELGIAELYAAAAGVEDGEGVNGNRHGKVNGNSGGNGMDLDSIYALNWTNLEEVSYGRTYYHVG